MGATSANRVTAAVTTTIVQLPSSPDAAFAALAESLTDALGRRGITFAPAAGAQISDGEKPIGRVTAWLPGERLALELSAGGSEAPVIIELSLAEQDEGTVATLTQSRWPSVVQQPDDMAGWVGGELLAPLVAAVSPRQLEDWLTDRRARRPSGAHARESYREPMFHLPNFGAILALLEPGPEDRLLEVGCGGGVLLAQALATGCSAAAIDHSPAMVALARERNAAAIAEGRLRLEVADAHRLPFAAGSFTLAAMTSVLGFIADPVAALAEIRRTLTPGGRMVVHGSDPAWRGTPAAPEPIASRMHFYPDDELAEIGRRAGFADADVRRINLAEYARAAGLPEEYVEMYDEATPFLVAGFG